jgi:hypothetical protein
MLIYSMSVSVDGYIADRDGAFGWTAPSDELFAFHLARVRELGAYLCGRKLYETMLPWETDPFLRDTELGAEFQGRVRSLLRRDRRHAIPATRDGGDSSRPDRDQNVRLTRDLRALPARQRRPGLNTAAGTDTGHLETNVRAPRRRSKTARRSISC